MNSEYVVDFDRMNELCSHPNDNPNSPGYQPGFCYATTRKWLKEYMDMYMNYPKSNLVTTEMYQQAFDTLHYNKVLVSKADIREGKIDDIIKPQLD